MTPGLSSRLLLTALLYWGHAAAAGLSNDTPLLAYAEQQRFEPFPDENQTRTELAAAEFAVSRHELPSQGCAKTLGATRFARLWAALGLARSNRADHLGAAEAYRRAVDCTPRDANALANLAAELQWTGAADEARMLVERALSITPNSAELHRQLAQMDFVEQRWAQAMANYRRAAALETLDSQALYSVIMFHLTQRRAGIAAPEEAARPKRSQDTDRSGEDESDEDPWPTAILETLRSTRSEESLLEESKRDDGYPGTQERLCEALFYIGQERLARGEREMARRYFSAVVNTRVLYYIEHNLALAELEKFRNGTYARAPAS